MFASFIEDVFTIATFPELSAGFLATDYDSSSSKTLGQKIKEPTYSRSLTCSATMDSRQAQEAESAIGTSGRGLQYTTYEANAWAAVFSKSGVSILVDPWLVEELIFAGQAWLYRGKKTHIPPPDLDKVADGVDALILSQGLPDHAHVPTLQRLPKDLPIVASPAGAQVAAGLGFSNITALDHGEETTIAGGKLKIRATAGALVGPPWAKRENGFVFTEQVPDGISLYYEPHCDYEESSLAGIDSADIIITPCVNQELLSYPLVMGKQNVVGLLKRLRPSVLLPLVNAEFDSEGPLSKLISEKGSVQELEPQLPQEGLGNVRVLVPEPAKPLCVEL
ncbi:g3342 [Coccomyxa elongata]